MTANTLELEKLPAREKQFQYRLRSILVLLSLIVAGYMGNYFALPIIFHIDWLFGSIFVMLVVRLYGLGWGTIAAMISSAYTISIWNHPYGFILFTLEAVVVGWGLQRRSNNLLLIDVVYWAIIGFPLLWLLYGVVGKIPFQSVLLISFKNPINEICNALIASLILTHTPITKWLRVKNSRTHAFEQTLLNLLVAFVLLPAMLLTIWNCQDATLTEEKSVLANLEDIRQNVSTNLIDWHQQSLVKLQALASREQESDLLDEAGMQEKIKIVQETIPEFRNLYTTDTEGNILNSTAVQNINQKAAKLDYLPFQTLLTAKQPMLSEVVTISNLPTIMQTVPIFQSDRLVGQVFAEIDINTLKKRLLNSQTALIRSVSLLDRENRIVASTRSELKLGETFDRDGNGEIRQLNQNTHIWIPNLSKASNGT